MFVADTSELKALRAQLLHAQKMEAIGTLAGGIAHDFNNLLTVIQGFCELLLMDKKEGEKEYADLRKIAQSARHGADLIRQILTFSRKVETERRPMDLNREIRSAHKMLLRTVPKMITIELRLSHDLKKINADPAQIEQIVLNLAVNAKDAMPDGGKLVIETRNVILDDAYCKTQPEATPGEYVLLAMSDTGHGMPPHIMERIFEPFFTTKEPGAGTGLGLAMVFGIVKGHEGHITCLSKPGAGTTFNVYLPAIETEEEAAMATGVPAAPLGTETILLVDDEEFIRDLGRKVLIRAGYKVLTAVSGKEALDIYQKKGSEIDLIILDLIMPEMSGKECLGRLLEINSKAKILIASGYFAEGPVTAVTEGLALGFIAKPYNLNKLLRLVREALER